MNLLRRLSTIYKWNDQKYDKNEKYFVFKKLKFNKKKN